MRLRCRIMLNLFDTLSPNQRAEFHVEACSLVSAARGMGIHLELSDLKALANQRFQKQLSEAKPDEQP